MPLNADVTFEKRLEALPLATYQAGETIFAPGTKTGLLLFLKRGTVAIVKGDIEITKVSEPGAVFGEMSALLDQEHTAEVRALEASQFYVADAAMVVRDPSSLLYIATALARRLDAANQTLSILKSQCQEDQPHDMVGKTIEAIEGLLSANCASFAYAKPAKMRFFVER